MVIDYCCWSCCYCFYFYELAMSATAAEGLFHKCYADYSAKRPVNISLSGSGWGVTLSLVDDKGHDK